jgi:quinol monooxygenase YgiN
MIIVIGSIVTTPESHAEMLALSLEHVARSRTEPGCIAHNVHVDCEQEQRLVFVEYWRDMPALLAHFAVPDSNRFVDAMAKLSPGAPEIKILTAEEQQTG